ncbi:ribosomal protein S18 acetylase RimI-like enzyme [Mesorhizobium sp. J18]|uniref:GNAT family N-acetyltransferase n=1 Tax=Mesorhizobium sp. J18 TaxID=935263 RepID=UPI00119B4F78|nr:GNAT family N-acetyltransferase [Mesorhizobium sp. J18]TWG97999.1 ribosomal protein S18 acetylase RimI-like enzyme [Mesorhizobium sp. J18]
MTAVTVRPVERSDHAEWRRLWTAYLEFYETSVSEVVYETTWRRLFTEGEFEPNGMLAIVEGSPVGLVHYLMHRTCWSEKNNCYLQDLFADPQMRGKGVGRALIEAVYAEADRLGAGAVYWTTQEFNHTARRLYDRVARKTPFIKYQR